MVLPGGGLAGGVVVRWLLCLISLLFGDTLCDCTTAALCLELGKQSTHRVKANPRLAGSAILHVP